jgi:hypothetical protein
MSSCTQFYVYNKHDIFLGYRSDITVLPAIFCDVWFNWDASKDYKFAYFKPPTNYPCPENLIGGKYFKANIITFKGLTNAWNRTHNELFTGIWEKKHADLYLSVETFNKKTIEALIENAMNCKYFHFFDDKKNLYPIEYYAISLLKEKIPAKYQMLPIPVLWNRGNDLDIHIDVPMHLLFLGITKSIVCMIQAWFALRSSTNDFTKHVTSVKETFNGLGLTWLVCIPYIGAKLGD